MTKNLQNGDDDGGGGFDCFEVLHRVTRRDDAAVVLDFVWQFQRLQQTLLQQRMDICDSGENRKFRANFHQYTVAEAWFDR